MLAVVVGLVGALVYGSADFLGGTAARRISALKVAAIGGASGLVLLLVAFVFIGGEFSSEALILGALSGVFGAIALALLYACLALGPMSILSPLTAVVSAVVPLSAGLIRGERLAPIGYLALVIALIAVVLVGFVPDKRAVRPSLKALAMAVGAGCFIGGFLIVIDLTPDKSGLLPLLANRLTSVVLLSTAVAVVALISARRGRAASALLPDSQPTVTLEPRAGGSAVRTGVLLATASGFVDASANLLLLLGLRLGELSIISVLTAMYPAGTILLAAVLLKERIAPSQAVGLVLALVAAAMLALA